MSKTVPPVPYKVPIVDENNFLSGPWSNWFRDMYARIGGTAALTNIELENQIGSLTTSVTGITDVITVSEETITLSTATATTTIPTAVGNLGKRLTYVHRGNNLTDVYTLAANGGESIYRGNVAQTSFIMHTTGQVVTFESDNSNWFIIKSETETPWIDAGALVITASTTNPTKGTTVVDKVHWKRIGQNVHIMMNYRQTAVGANGTGDYLFNIPTGLVIDTTIISAEATAQGIGSNPRNSNLGSACGHLSTTVNLIGYAALWDSTKVTMNVGAIATTSTSIATIGSAYAALGNASVSYLLNFIAPISGWES